MWTWASIMVMEGEGIRQQASGNSQSGISKKLSACYLPLLTWRTKRSSKNCAGLAVFASGIDSERKSKIP